MTYVELVRNEVNRDGVFGIMRIASAALMLYTCEDDWRNNEKGRSCIPHGMYILKRTIYQKHRMETFEVTNVVGGRKRILIHPGNTEEDTEGCILVGTRRGEVQVLKDEDTDEPNRLKRAVVNSRTAFAQFMQALADVDTARLSIVWGIGLP